METIAVYIIVNGEFKAVEIPPVSVGELSEMLRNDGKTRVQTTKGDYMAEGLYIPARGLKRSMLIFDEEVAE